MGTYTIQTKESMLNAIGNINSPLLDMPLKNSLAMKSGVGSATFTRASTATYIDRYGVLKTAAVDEPRFEKEGYLNEGGSTNLFTYSNDFTNAIWNDLGTATTGQISPSGNADAFLYTTAVLNTNAIYQDVTFTSNTNTISIFVKAGTSSSLSIRTLSFDTNNTCQFNLATMTAGTNGSIKEVGAGWYRCSLTVTLTGADLVGQIYYYLATDAGTNYSSTIGNSMYVYGAQLEALPFATSYIPTTTTAVTSAVNFLNVTREGNLPNIEVNGEISIAYDIVSFGNTSSNQWIWGLYTSSPDSIGAYISPSGYLRSACTSVTDYNTASGPLISKNQKYRIVQVINIAGNSLYVDGVLVSFTAGTDDRLTDTQNSAFTQLRIGSYTPTVSIQAPQFYGSIANFRIWDRSLTAQEVALV